ncbi:MAG: NAD(P)-dependent oxidoreductase [Holosporales bacterium]|jgi:nucleoside-diphosphate-sugar epimerase|nr:NAD(P)-dependent oxidoreductase [Holosporales bacterium]
MLTHLNSKEIAPKRVVVLGAGGFIGKHLVKTLQNDGIAILPITRNEIDLEKSEAVQKLLDTLQHTDSVVFLSAITPDKGKGVDALMSNLNMGRHFVQALTQKPVAHVVYLSSDAVYSFKNTIINESSPANPADFHGAMHRTREIMLNDLHTDLAIVRPVAVYGAGDPHNGYGPNRFLRQARDSGEISLFGKGEEIRNHLYIGDLISIITKILYRRSVGLVNASSLKSYSFYEVATIIIGKLGRGKIAKTERPNATITHRHMDATCLFRAFPDLTLTELRESIDKIMKFDV